MKPYYETELGKLYHGDCVGIMKDFEAAPVDLILTDPPYGINADSNAARAATAAGGRHGWRNYGKTNWDTKRPSPYCFNLMREISKNQIIWGGNYFADLLPAYMGWLVWDKGQRDFSLADGELAWTSFNNALRIFNYARAKAMQDGKEHPTQKAINIMIQSIQYADKNSKSKNMTILDPFLGSGTTAVVCERLDRKWIGIEINKDYCDIAIKRIEAERAQHKLFKV